MENIKKILDSEIGLSVEKVNGEDDYSVIDNRFELLKATVDSIDNKDDDFYANLISLMSEYIDLLYDSRIEKPEDYKGIVFDKEGQMLPQEKDFTECEDDFICLKTFSHRANVDLVRSLFDYTCDILEKNKDVTLDIETLTRLLSRNPKSLSLSVDVDYVYRVFDFTRLAQIVQQNEMLDKADISIDGVYQLLIDTCQLDNEFVFPYLVDSEEFKNNHSKIDELLKNCGALSFVNVTNIIVRYLDENFDRLSYIKNRKDEIFTGYVIIYSLKSAREEKDYDLVHAILTDSDIGVNYGMFVGDYFGSYSVRDCIAFRGNKAVIRDLLSKEEDINRVYWYRDSEKYLYNLYAIAGYYEEALSTFDKNYCYYADDYMGNLDNSGYARGNIPYRDYLGEFVGDICKSFKDEDIASTNKKDIISSILTNEKIKYIDLDGVLPVVQSVLVVEDYKSLVDTLLEKRNSRVLNFIVVEGRDEIKDDYCIRIANDEDVSQILSRYANKDGNKVLSKKTNN